MRLSPPPAPRSRPSVRPSASAAGRPSGQRAAPRPARGGRGKQNNAAREVTRGHQAPLRSAPLRLEPARSLRYAR